MNTQKALSGIGAFAVAEHIMIVVIAIIFNVIERLGEPESLDESADACTEAIVENFRDIRPDIQALIDSKDRLHELRAEIISLEEQVKYLRTTMKPFVTRLN